jgi:outer membrane immunogenic protein
MSRCVLRSALVGSLLAGVSSVAFAADLPVQMPAYKAPPLVAIYNWSGPYAGINAGYQFGSGNSDGLDGGLVGGTLGYNWQVGNLVFGLEGDIGWANFGASQTAVVPPVTVNVTSEANWFATVRGRFGYAFDRNLVYVTGGGAFASNKITVNVTVGALTAGLSDTQTHSGYVVGGGFEHAFTNQWSAKVEYLYANLGSENYFQQFAGGLPSGDVPVHTVRAGLNYHFMSR